MPPRSAVHGVPESYIVPTAEDGAIFSGISWVDFPGGVGSAVIVSMPSTGSHDVRRTTDKSLKRTTLAIPPPMWNVRYPSRRITMPPMQLPLSTQGPSRVHPSTSETTLSFQRSRDRLGVLCPVMFAGATFIGEATALNLSLAGCLVEGDRAVLEGSYLTIRLLLPDNRPALIIDLAAVRWVRTNHCGIEFLRIPSLELHRLEHFLTAHRR